jgi:predicted cupin superfamily sugar epimerase
LQIRRSSVLVPRGTWQGSRLRPGGRFALLGATVSPGFEFSDFELEEGNELMKRYPRFRALIPGFVSGVK